LVKEKKSAHAGQQQQIGAQARLQAQPSGHLIVIGRSLTVE